MMQNNKFDIINNLTNLVEKACKEGSNQFGFSSWTHHILPVVQFSKALAKKLNADEEIVVISALLHDYAGILGNYEDHHIHGAEIAQNILEDLDYPQERINQVKHCIFTHRASKSIPRETIEAQIVASADAMAHIECYDSLLYLAYAIKKMGIQEGTDWVLAKLERSWNKLIPQAKDILTHKYEAIKVSLSKGI